MMTREQQEVVLFSWASPDFCLLLTSESFSHPSNVLPATRCPFCRNLLKRGGLGGSGGPGSKSRDLSAPKGEKRSGGGEKAGGISGGLSLSPEFAAIKIEKSGLLKVAWKGEDKARRLFTPWIPKAEGSFHPDQYQHRQSRGIGYPARRGPKMARAIVDFRESHGKFSTLEDLQKVKGFGPRKFAAIRPHITLTD